MSLGWIYTAISWILLKWHALWDAADVGRWLSTDWEWVLATIFLVLTIRGLLFPVFVKQIKSQRAMQALQPKITELREKHKGDRAGLQQAQMALMKEENANPLMGCLPLFVQAPVFIGLFHVLRHLKPTMPQSLRTLYGWTVGQFDSASHATLFGAPISSSVRSSASDLAALHATALNVRIVAGVLVAVMIVTTYLTSRQMILKTGWATDPTQLMVQRLMLYGVPIGLLFSGAVFPIGVVIYWVTTNIFSLGQQFYVLRKFPPPVNANAGASGKNATAKAAGGKLVPAPNSKPIPAPNGRAAVLGGKTINGKVVDDGAAKPRGRVTGKAAKKGKDSTNEPPVAPPPVAGPKVGAKPINPKKGNAAKR
jgi:YidC/Oxa1 family membrane protein insertase